MALLIVNVMPASTRALMPLVLLVPLAAAALVLLGAPARRVSMTLRPAVNLLLALVLCATYERPFRLHACSMSSRRWT